MAEGVFGKGFGPGFQRGSGSAGGPEDIAMFLYAIMALTRKRRRQRKKIAVPKRDQRLLKFLQSLDAVRSLQLARASVGVFTSAIDTWQQQ